MKKKIWFYLFIVQTIILISVLAISLWPARTSFERVNLKEYLEEHAGINYMPDAGYIPDAQTAKIVGAQIIDNMVGQKSLTNLSVVVEYDEENRLWLVGKGYFPHHGGEVILEQDSGKVVKAFLTK